MSKRANAEILQTMDEVQKSNKINSDEMTASVKSLHTEKQRLVVSHLNEVKKNLRPAMGDIEAAIKLMNQSVKRACDALKQHEVQVVEDLQLTDVHTPANVAQQAAVRDARLSDAVVGKEKRTDSESEDEEVDYGYGSD